jgi:hypothetical protein
MIMKRVHIIETHGEKIYDIHCGRRGWEDPNKTFIS